jgi:hypothetical protein
MHRRIVPAENSHKKIGKFGYKTILELSTPLGTCLAHVLPLIPFHSTSPLLIVLFISEQTPASIRIRPKAESSFTHQF